MNCLILSVPVGTERRLEQRDWTKGLDTTSIHAAQSFSPNWRTATFDLCAYEEGIRAPSPEIDRWNTVLRKPALIINTIRWPPMHLFGEKSFDGYEKPGGAKLKEADGPPSDARSSRHDARRIAKPSMTYES